MVRAPSSLWLSVQGSAGRYAAVAWLQKVLCWGLDNLEHDRVQSFCCTASLVMQGAQQQNN